MKSKLYTPYQIEKMSDAAINKAYSQLRSIANKRLQRMQAQDIGKRAREGFRFPTIKEVQESSKWSMESQLADVSRFLRSERTTVSGEKKFLNEFVEQMQEKGYGDLVKSYDDIYNTIEFMDQMREQYSDKVFDSGDALDAYQHAQALGIPKEKIKDNIELFISHVDEFTNIQPNRNGKPIGQKRLNNLIKKWTK